MTYLSDTGRVVLAAAAQRDDLSVLPFPDGCKAKGGAERKVLSGLKKRGLIRIIETDGGPQRVVITSEGMAAIGVALDDEERPTTAAADNAALDDYPTRGTPADQGAWAARRDDMDRDSQADALVPDTAPTLAESDAPAVEAPAPTTEADGAATPREEQARQAQGQGEGHQGRAGRQRARGSDRRHADRQAHAARRHQAGAR